MLTCQQCGDQHAHAIARRKWPSEVIGAAVKVMRIAAGEEADDRQYKPVPTSVQEAGRLGGVARARHLGKEGRSQIARRAAASRWKAPSGA